VLLTEFMLYANTLDSSSKYINKLKKNNLGGEILSNTIISIIITVRYILIELLLQNCVLPLLSLDIFMPLMKVFLLRVQEGNLPQAKVDGR